MIKKHLQTKEKTINFYLEWSGVFSAILYSLLIALNIGAEQLGFVLLLCSASLIGFWAFLNKHQGILLLQVFYASAAIVGILRWT